jgi:hypothetical protein
MGTLALHPHAAAAAAVQGAWRRPMSALALLNWGPCQHHLLQLELELVQVVVLEQGPHAGQCLMLAASQHLYL